MHSLATKCSLMGHLKSSLHKTIGPQRTLFSGPIIPQGLKKSDDSILNLNAALKGVTAAVVLP